MRLGKSIKVKVASRVAGVLPLFDIFCATKTLSLPITQNGNGRWEIKHDQKGFLLVDRCSQLHRSEHESYPILHLFDATLNLIMIRAH